MSLRHPGWIAIALLGFLGCQGDESPTPGPAVPSSLNGTAVSLTRFRSDSVAYISYSGVTAPLTTVIRDPQTWDSLWRVIHAPASPEPPLPAVDFTQEMIVVAASGTHESGGYDILLARATEDDTGLRIDVIETSPGANCLTTQALSQPVDLARMPRRDGPTRFVTTRRVMDCGS